jgi:DNA-binding HxlR family transcriptional regulator
LKSARIGGTLPYHFADPITIGLAVVVSGKVEQEGVGVVQSTDAHPESCPVLKTADIISGKWTLLILRDLSKGINRFSALERSLVGISPKTLSERLKALEKAGIVTRKSYAEVPPRVEYTLTEMGWDLIPLIEHMRDYGTKWLNGSIGVSADDNAPGA